MTDSQCEAATGTRHTARWMALWGALGAVVLAFPFAASCALIYRFPIPFGSYASGTTAMLRALGAVVLYGILGGFPALLVVGALGGMAAYLLGRPALARIRQLTLAFAGLTALLGVGFLAILDTPIGPWQAPSGARIGPSSSGSGVFPTTASKREGSPPGLPTSREQPTPHERNIQRGMP